MPGPKIEQPTDVLVRITSTNICGSDLHMYEGRTNLEPGMVIGHKNLGEVVEVGPGVTRIRVGDMVLPDCAPGPADGRRRLRVRRDGAILATRRATRSSRYLSYRWPRCGQGL
jgi:threonine dehydrogenase-like Zn-dependent dehydrogenase